MNPNSLKNIANEFLMAGLTGSASYSIARTCGASPYFGVCCFVEGAGLGVMITPFATSLVSSTYKTIVGRNLQLYLGSLGAYLIFLFTTCFRLNQATHLFCLALLLNFLAKESIKLSSFLYILNLVSSLVVASFVPLLMMKHLF